jgi:hypothetical protein
MYPVRSYRGYLVDLYGNVMSKRTGSRMSPCRVISSSGSTYLKVNLSFEGRKQPFFVHRLVLTAFGLLGDGLHVDHLNSITTDNRLANLEAVTPRVNNIRRSFRRSV